jgi:plastocyanin
VRRVALVALAGVALALARVVGASATTTRTVKVGDDYYGPTKLTVNRGTVIRWTWLSDNTDSHDVKLTSAPTGVRKFKSASAATDYTFRRTLKAAGTYRFVCTLHQDMTMRVVVRR